MSSSIAGADCFSPNETMYQQCSSLKKTFSSLVQLYKLDIGNRDLVDCVTLQNYPS